LKYKKRRLLVLKRKHIKIIIIVLAVAIAATVLLLVTSANTRRSEKQHAVDTVAATGVINIGLRGDLSSLCTFNADTGIFEGLEKDVADEITSRLFPDGIIVNYVEVNSETKDSELKQGILDMSLGASVNEEKSGIQYSAPYFGDASAILVQGGQTTEVAQLNGKTVAVVQNSVLDESTEKDKNISVLQYYFSQQQIDVTVRKYASYPEAVEALKDGTVSAICASELNLKRFGMKGMLLLPDRFLPSRYCVQIRSGLGAFSEAVDDCIAEMKRDGTLAALSGKWNLVDYSALES
jgi:ABC-type amino acid transport substrate-binding protein